ncbi:bacterial regulatory protein, LacI family [Bifidobacterium reuteri DSM 23975]|uniref:Bacterial regulatory protein, LacI family n=1 Tax=Bifidobacterium reuteri DSM 23975 TaxID=1437610 RepID=A0A087CV15_9BIFI|nr:bacterial regulatory protein, LacI family [Bifidobacterium reuteri DSM 23975]
MSKAKVTITDVAKASGVSNSAVSYALNGKPGVSQETREKVLKVADQLGWRPNKAAKSLSDARTNSVGLVLTYDPAVLSVEAFGMELITGLTARLEEAGYSLLIRSSRNMRAELDILDDWIASGAVDGVFLQNVELGDPRIELMSHHLEMPTVVMGDESLAGGLISLSTNERDGVRVIAEYCADQGHRRIARVAGPENLGHTFIRDNAFMEVAARLGLQYTCLHADYTPEGGRKCTERLLSLPNAPTAIIYDNDVMALTGAQVAAVRGLNVPQDLSVISWDDSFLCEVNALGITALGHNIIERGRTAAGLLLDLIDGKPVESVWEPQEKLVVRASSGPLA